ncbi:MAG: hypothetical protein ACRDE2_09720, partial [Chitinophagaceae bacterium]
MLKQLIKREYYLDKHLEAPLLREREEYLQYRADKGISLSRVKSIADYLLRIVQFLPLETEDIVTIEAVERAASAWGKFQYNHPMKKSFSKTGVKRFFDLSIDWLKRINRLEPLLEEQIPLFSHLFERRHALKRHISAPLLQERLRYLQHWTELKAKNST